MSFAHTRRAGLLVLTVMFAAAPSIASAGSVILAWDANTESNLAGYIIRYGTASKTYVGSVNVGPRTTYEIGGLQEGRAYYFVVQAYNTAGLTSPYSEEVAGVATDGSTSSCNYTLSSSGQFFGEGGGAGTVNVTASGTGCAAWPVTSNVPWTSVMSGATGIGNGIVRFSVAANDGPDRTGALVIANRVFTVTQAGDSDSDLEFESEHGYYLAEGATGIFSLDYAIANPNTEEAPIGIRFLKEDGTTVRRSETLGPLSQRILRVNDVPGLAAAAVSAVIESEAALPLLVERSMFWGHAGHTEAAVGSPARRWYFAEGSQGFFDTFILLANASARIATVDLTFLRETQAPFRRTYTVAPNSRFNIYTGAITELQNQSFSIVVESDVPIIAERAMYFGPGWSGGHGSAGVHEPATEWFHAEGATGDYFDTFVLVANPNNAPATLEFTYLLSSGETVTKQRVMEPESRLTVYLKAEDERLRDTAVSTIVTSNIPVISERSMYWPGNGRLWQEAHNSFGVTRTATRWGLADGRVGGARHFETYILLANPSDFATRVRITYLRTTGDPLVKEYMLPPTTRFNVHANSMVPELANEAFGAIIESLDGVPIAVERAFYFNGWRGGTNATAVPLP